VCVSHFTHVVFIHKMAALVRWFNGQVRHFPNVTTRLVVYSLLLCLGRDGGVLRSVYLFVWLYVSLSVREHISETLCPIFVNNFVHVTYGSVLLWRRCDTMFYFRFSRMTSCLLIMGYMDARRYCCSERRIASLWVSYRPCTIVLVASFARQRW